MIERHLLEAQVGPAVGVGRGAGVGCGLEPGTGARQDHHVLDRPQPPTELGDLGPAGDLAAAVPVAVHCEQHPRAQGREPLRGRGSG